MPSHRLVLASSSPRRRELLTQIGLAPDSIVCPDIDETLYRGELPRQHAERLADEKLTAGQSLDNQEGAFVLAADTVVAMGRRVLPKAEDTATARDCLERLSGRRHRVYGGIALSSPDGHRVARLATTIVRFKRLSTSEIDAYLAGGDWRGKAGGYAIQGMAARFIPWINGSYSNVVGLALHDVAAMLEGLGFRR